MSNAIHTGGLYPIIRRIRRPLLPVDPPAEAKPIINKDDGSSKPTDTSSVVDEKKTDASDSNK